MTRRNLLKSLTGAVTLPWLGSALSANKAETVTEVGTVITPLHKSKTEWQKLLPADAYAVLFEEATERPNSSALNNEHRAGTFVCAACHLPLFTSQAKFNSGTGWPSFTHVIEGHLGTRSDYALVWPRTEYHCARCGGHQGHVFDDGPSPRGKRYCNNGVALRFVPQAESLPALRS